ncbi:hypothetical protein Dimus_000067 [Dionaea muscipula]
MGHGPWSMDEKDTDRSQSLHRLFPSQVIYFFIFPSRFHSCVSVTVFPFNIQSFPPFFSFFSFPLKTFLVGLFLSAQKVQKHLILHTWKHNKRKSLVTRFIIYRKIEKKDSRSLCYFYIIHINKIVR